METSLSTEQLKTIIFTYLEFQFLNRLKKIETKKQENTRRKFHKKIAENMVKNLLQNDETAPIVDYEIFSKEIDETGVYEKLDEREKFFYREHKEMFFLEWYVDLFPVKTVYKVVWTMIEAAEALSEKTKFKPEYIINEMFPTNPPDYPTKQEFVYAVEKSA